MDAKDLAKIIYEELESEGWDDIDPYWVGSVGGVIPYSAEDEVESVESMRRVMERVASRLNLTTMSRALDAQALETMGFIFGEREP